MVEGERNWAYLMEKAWCMTEKAKLFGLRSLLNRIVDRSVTSHDDVEGQLRLTRLAAPTRKGREVRTAWWQCLTDERRMESLGTSQVNNSGDELERK